MARKIENPGVGTGHGIRPEYEHECQDCQQMFMAKRSDVLRCPACAKKRELELARIARREKAQKRGAWRPQNECPKCGGPKDRHALTCWNCIPRGGENNPNWKGGRVKSGEYIAVRLQRGKAKYTGEHIAVWEAVNGPVPKGWQVHHLNGIKTDNRIENLIALSNSDHHSFSHNQASEIFEKRIQELEAQLSQK